jgi:hypothetical protein
MQQFLLAVVAALLLAINAPIAHAGIANNMLFTCDGELSTNQDFTDGKTYYDIVKKNDDQFIHCGIDDGKALRQVLAVCHVGDFCTVAAKGTITNGPSYLIHKVFEVQRQPGVAK